MVAEQTISVSGDFYEEMEMKNYPFDTQPLKIGRFRFNKAREALHQMLGHWVYLNVLFMNG